MSFQSGNGDRRSSSTPHLGSGSHLTCYHPGDVFLLFISPTSHLRPSLFLGILHFLCHWLPPTLSLPAGCPLSVRNSKTIQTHTTCLLISFMSVFMSFPAEEIRYPTKHPKVYLTLIPGYSPSQGVKIAGTQHTSMLRAENSAYSEHGLHCHTQDSLPRE